MVRWDSPENAFKVPPNWRRAQEEIEKELLQQRRKVRHQPQRLGPQLQPRSLESGRCENIQTEYEYWRCANL